MITCGSPCASNAGIEKKSRNVLDIGMWSLF
jgi:hypothetical protein